MSGAGAVVALVLLEWAAGIVAGAAWTQSWAVVRRGHFRIAAWTAAAFAVLGGLALQSSSSPGLVWTFVGSALFYLAAQYARSDVVGAVVGFACAVLGLAAFLALAFAVAGWPAYLAAAELAVGAVLLGAVTNGMLLGHWYLNQPGLKPWALARLTTATLAAVGLSAGLGVAAAGRLATASTGSAILGLPGLGDSFGPVLFAIWLALVGFTGAVVWGAHRCVKIRSIQSATGLYYVALLTAGISEFVVRYLMVSAA